MYQNNKASNCLFNQYEALIDYNVGVCKSLLLYPPGEQACVHDVQDLHPAANLSLSKPPVIFLVSLLSNSFACIFKIDLLMINVFKYMPTLIKLFGIRFNFLYTNCLSMPKQTFLFQWQELLGICNRDNPIYHVHKLLLYRANIFF
jgi:hypothetical protein